MAASYGAPGVYIEEQPSGSMPIEGVGTAVAAFVGFTEHYDVENGDPTDPAGVRPQLVTSCGLMPIGSVGSPWSTS